MVPAWVVNNLGARVQTARVHEGAFHVYPSTSACRIVSIRAGENGAHYAVVVFEDDPTGIEQSVSFDTIHPLHFYRR